MSSSTQSGINSLFPNICKGFCFLVGVFLFAMYGNAQQHVPFTGNNSMSYEECIQAYSDLAAKYPEAMLMEMGKSDVGKPIHLFVINLSRKFNPGMFEKDKAVLLVNNGIHPGEPCGIDASLLFANDVLSIPEYRSMLSNTIICIIPVYNVGGALNRGCCSRANQNGPAEYGFRGNARNLDLNRDFIKMDSQNARAFAQIFQAVKPHMFLDTHTSNGADYQYVMTMITTQPDKASESMGGYIRKTINPELFKIMDERGWGMTPYVNTMGRTPDDGIMDFLETPRYSTGYAALYNTIGFTSETHMFKPFADRVESTYQFEMSLFQLMNERSKEIISQREKANEAVRKQKKFALQWELDTTKWKDINFKGFEAEFSTSDVTSQERLHYNREKPWERKIRHYDAFKTTLEVEAPDYYVIPQAWMEVIGLLSLNGVKLEIIKADTTMLVEAYHIADYKTVDSPYEGHYLHSKVEVEKVKEEIRFYRGDMLVPVNQVTNRFIVETLEPQGVDSYFAWNYFDAVLQQKEWFSDYVFEDQAAEMLSGNAELKRQFEEKKASEPEFAANHWWMLYWLYQRSEHFENSFNRYPVYRLSGK
jgi:hypothetical protein